MTSTLAHGISRVDITPDVPQPMGGYGGRLDVFDGVHDPLTFTALYLNHEGREVWLGSADLVQFPDGAVRDAGLARLAARLGCGEEALFLTASHTHGGPLTVTEFGVSNAFNRIARSGRNKEVVDAYVDRLWDRIGDALEQARHRATPGRLQRAESRTTFPMNRRRLVDGEVVNAPHPEGAFDERLRLLGIRDTEGTLRVVAPILACHPTATGAQHRLTADYVGAWRTRVEAEWPDVTMLFLSGCGGDARPAASADGSQWKRLRVGQLKDLGAHLWSETRAAAEAGWRDLGEPVLSARRRELTVFCENALPGPEDLRALAEGGDPVKADFARACLERLDRGESVPDQVTLRLHTLRLTEDCALLGMDFEPVWGLGRFLESALAGFHPVAVGYTNGCLGYVPGRQERLEGGYECESYYWGPWSGPFLSDTEDRIADAFRDMLETPLKNHE